MRALPARIRGYTLLELAISGSIGAAILGALVLASSALLRVFNASDYHYRSTAAQMRVMDYLTRDLRGALTVSVTNAGQKLDLTLPDYIDSGANQPRVPTLRVNLPVFGRVSGTVDYGSASSPVSVSYYLSGQQVIRKEGLVETVLANDVENFQFTAVDSLSSKVTTTLTFAPKFNRLNFSAARAGTAVSSTTVLRNPRRN